MISAPLRLRARIEGAGDRTLVLGNGFCTSAGSWQGVVDRLPADVRVVRFDYAGNPGTPEEAWHPERHATLHGHADDVLDLLDALDVRGAVFVGHSMSGTIGALVQRAAPERLAHLVLLSASPSFVDEPGRYVGGSSAETVARMLEAVDADVAAWMAGFARHVTGPTAPAQLAHDYLAHLLRLRPDIARATLRAIFLGDFRDVFAHVDCPTTIVQPARDVLVPPAVGRWLQAHLPAATLEELDVDGHLAHLTHPAAIARLVTRALDTVRGDGARPAR